MSMYKIINAWNLLIECYKLLDKNKHAEFVATLEAYFDSEGIEYEKEVAR